MNRKEQIKRDSTEIEQVITKYGGATAAHFGFIAHATGERMFWSGGNAAIIGICLAEAIAELIQHTPGMDGEEFLKAVTETTMKILEHGGTVQ